MDPRVRYAPVGALALLLVIRVFKHDFLAFSPFTHKLASWITWFLLLFLILVWWSAFLLAPAFVHAVNASARYHLLPPIVVFSIVIALIWGADMMWNSLVDPWCEACGKSHMLPSLTAAISGP